MAMRLMLVILNLHQDACNLSNLQHSSLTSLQRQINFSLHTLRRMLVDSVGPFVFGLEAAQEGLHSQFWFNTSCASYRRSWTTHRELMCLNPLILQNVQATILLELCI
jgi:hypothetical protein